MRGYDFTLAVVGVAASVATFAINAFQPSSVNLHSNHSHATPEVMEFETMFSKYAASYNKDYSSKEEYELRLAQFEKAQKEIAALNSRNSGATFGLNEFSDWTDEEY